MAIAWNFGDLCRAAVKAIADFRANKALPAAPEMTGPQIAAALAQLQAGLPAVIATLNKYPGAITGIDDVLDALRAEGVPYAADIEAAVNAAPGALAQAQAWLPWILPFMSSGPAPSTYADQNKRRGQI